jgi:hypothetical protein
MCSNSKVKYCIQKVLIHVNYGNAGEIDRKYGSLSYFKAKVAPNKTI